MLRSPQRTQIACGQPQLRWLTSALACFASLLPAAASAYEASVDGQTVLQLYTVQGFYGTPSLSRQRLTHQLGLDVVNVAGSAWHGEPWINVRVRMRMDGDYGISPAEQDPNNSDYFVPGLKTAPVDILYAYVEGGGWLHDTVGFRLGRQLFFDELGWWSFDGARLAFTPGRLFELAGYVGFEQRGGLPFLSTGRYEAGGVYRGNREGLSATQWPGYLQSNTLAPATGASIVLLAVPHLRARADYRRVWQRDQVVTSPFLNASGQLSSVSMSRVSTERAGASVGYDFGQLASSDGAVLYDLYRGKVIEHRATVDSHLSDQVRLSVNYQYRLPSFDADSIFNWFGAVGSTVIRSRLGIELRRDWTVGATAGVRWYAAPFASAVADSGNYRGAEKNWLGGVDSTWHNAKTLVRFSNTAEVGDAGDRWVGDALFSYQLDSGTVTPTAIVTLARWRDHLRTDFNSMVLTYVLGCRYSPKHAPIFGVDWEHSVSDVLAQRFRVVGTIDVRWP